MVKLYIHRNFIYIASLHLRFPHLGYLFDTRLVYCCVKQPLECLEECSLSISIITDNKAYLKEISSDKKVSQRAKELEAMISRQSSDISTTRNSGA